MKHMTKCIGLMLMVLTLNTSCKKKAKEPEAPSVKELLTGTPWDLYMLEQYDASGNLTDTQMLAFTYDFRSDNSLIITTPSGTYHWTYELLDNDQKIRIQNASTGSDITYKIVNINAYEMMWRNPATDTGTGYLLIYFNK
jgi:hypothetical protein